MIWRDPPEATEDYPGLEVHDRTVTGSIRCGGRLPLWAFLPWSVGTDWTLVEESYGPGEYGFDRHEAARFLSDLLEARGEFARLVCVIADVEREAGEREEYASDAHWRAAHAPGDTVCECMPELPGPWWWQDDLKARMAAQLRACLDVLEESP